MQPFDTPRHTTGFESERVAVLAEQFGVHERQVVIALDYVYSKTGTILTCA